MAKFRATAKGYYGDVIHDPETDHHVVFDAPDDWSASWAEKVDAETPVQEIKEVSVETEDAEAILNAESEAAKEDIPDAESETSKEDIPIDVNKEAGVETL